MIYHVEFSEGARRTLKKLDKYTQKIILLWVEKNLEGSSNPRIHGKALVGNLAYQWRYRIGDYRLLTLIKDDKLIILVIAIGHRKDIYK